MSTSKKFHTNTNTTEQQPSILNTGDQSNNPSVTQAMNAAQEDVEHILKLYDAFVPGAATVPLIGETVPITLAPATTDAYDISYNEISEPQSKSLPYIMIPRVQPDANGENIIGRYTFREIPHKPTDSDTIGSEYGYQGIVDDPKWNKKGVIKNIRYARSADNKEKGTSEDSIRTQARSYEFEISSDADNMEQINNLQHISADRDKAELAALRFRMGMYTFILATEWGLVNSALRCGEATISVVEALHNRTWKAFWTNFYNLSWPGRAIAVRIFLLPIYVLCPFFWEWKSPHAWWQSMGVRYVIKGGIGLAACFSLDLFTSGGFGPRFGFLDSFAGWAIMGFSVAYFMTFEGTSARVAQRGIGTLIGFIFATLSVGFTSRNELALVAWNLTAVTAFMSICTYLTNPRPLIKGIEYTGQVASYTCVFLTYQSFRDPDNAQTICLTRMLATGCGLGIAFVMAHIPPAISAEVESRKIYTSAILAATNCCWDCLYIFLNILRPVKGLESINRTSTITIPPGLAEHVKSKGSKISQIGLKLSEFISRAAQQAKYWTASRVTVTSWLNIPDSLYSHLNNPVAITRESINYIRSDRMVLATTLLTQANCNDMMRIWHIDPMVHKLGCISDFALIASDDWITTAAKQLEHDNHSYAEFAYAFADLESRKNQFYYRNTPRFTTSKKLGKKIPRPPKQTMAITVLMRQAYVSVIRNSQAPPHSLQEGIIRPCTLAATRILFATPSGMEVRCHLVEYADELNKLANLSAELIKAVGLSTYARIVPCQCCLLAIQHCMSPPRDPMLKIPLLESKKALIIKLLIRFQRHEASLNRAEGFFMKYLADALDELRKLFTVLGPTIFKDDKKKNDDKNRVNNSDRHLSVAIETRRLAAFAMLALFHRLDMLRQCVTDVKRLVIAVLGIPMQLLGPQEELTLFGSLESARE